jgi:hypothetical protein
MKMKRFFVVMTLLVIMGMVLASCATPTPETIIETVEVKVVETGGQFKPLSKPSSPHRLHHRRTASPQ